MPVSMALLKKLDKVDAELKDVLLSILDEAERNWEERKEFHQLTEIVNQSEQSILELTDVWKRTEIRINELAETQKRIEHRIEELAVLQKESLETQKQAEQKLGELSEVRKSGVKNLPKPGREAKNFVL